LHAAHAARLGQNFLHLGILVNLHAAAAGTLRQRHRRIDGVGLAVGGKKHTADDVGDVEQRPSLLDLAGADHLDV
jgi:hypothetical protein